MVDNNIFNSCIFPACGDMSAYEDTGWQCDKEWQTKEKMVELISRRA